MTTEEIEFNDRVFAYVIRADETPDNTQFYTYDDLSFQFGIVAHKKGYVEPAHAHKLWSREIIDTTETLTVTNGSCKIGFFDDDGTKLGETTLNVGDAIMLIGCTGHNFEALEDFRGVKTKQGPYTCIEEDKLIL